MIDLLYYAYHGIAIGSITGLFFIGRAILGKQGSLIVTKEYKILGTKIVYTSQNQSGVTITAKKIQ